MTLMSKLKTHMYHLKAAISLVQMFQRTHTAALLKLLSLQHFRLLISYSCVNIDAWLELLVGDEST